MSILCIFFCITIYSNPTKKTFDVAFYWLSTKLSKTGIHSLESWYSWCGQKL